jgi:hypothetical protein
MINGRLVAGHRVYLTPQWVRIPLESLQKTKRSRILVDLRFGSKCNILSLNLKLTWEIPILSTFTSPMAIEQRCLPPLTQASKSAHRNGQYFFRLNAFLHTNCFCPLANLMDN